jgi:hypothetical protein
MRNLAAMLAAVLVVSGLFAIAYGSWRGYVAARTAMLPLLREGDPTRTLIEAGRPLHARARVRLAVRQVLLAVGWLTVALYGLYLATVGSAVGA